MRGNTHGLSGAALWLAVGPAVGMTVDPETVTVTVAAAAGAALLPDLDHPEATPANALWPVGRPLSRAVASAAGGHRAATHWLVMGPLVAGLLAVGVAVTPIVGAVAVGVAVLLGVASQTKSVARYPAAVTAGWAVAAGHVDAGLIPWAVAVGWTAHVLGDALTASGVPLAGPFSRKRLGLPLFTTGDAVEGVVAVGLVGLIGWLGWSIVGPQISVG